MKVTFHENGRKRTLKHTYRNKYAWDGFSIGEFELSEIKIKSQADVDKLIKTLEHLKIGMLMSHK